MPTATEEPLLTIGQLAERAGLNTSHIRFYERVGVLPEPERVSGQRRYRPEVLHRLSIIDVAQRAGLTPGGDRAAHRPREPQRRRQRATSARWPTTSCRTSTR